MDKTASEIYLTLRSKFFKHELSPLLPLGTGDVADADARHEHHVSDVLLEEQEEAVEGARHEREGPQPRRVALQVPHTATREQRLQRDGTWSRM